MKITILQGAFLPVPAELGGAIEKMWFALGKEFARRGHDVIHISRQYKHFPSQEIIAGVHHTRIKGFATPSSGLYLKMLDLVYSFRSKLVIPLDSEVIVTNTFWAPLLLNAKLRRRCFIDVQRIPKGQMKMYRNAARLRANSSYVAEAIKNEIPVPKRKKVVMIPNPLPFEINDKDDYEQKVPILLYVGRIHPEKGLELLIKAFREIKTDWVLKIIGPYDIAAGGGGKKYLNTLRKLSAESNIEFIGPVYDVHTLNQHYMKASLFVYPSIAERGETFGLAPLEAMAWGCVPIVSNLSCFKDFIEDGSNGLIFDHRAKNADELLRKALTSLVTNPALTRQLSIKAREVRETHSITLIGCHFLDEFEKMILEVKA